MGSLARGPLSTLGVVVAGDGWCVVAVGGVVEGDGWCVVAVGSRPAEYTFRKSFSRG
jgi:hypothetical protein